jgi:hypothetical protein
MHLVQIFASTDFTSSVVFLYLKITIYVYYLLFYQKLHKLLIFFEYLFLGEYTQKRPLHELQRSFN